jgi:hypothetical protein
MRIVDPEKGEHKPIDIDAFMRTGEYDQGDVALVSYDDLYDLIHGRRTNMANLDGK